MLHVYISIYFHNLKLNNNDFRKVCSFPFDMENMTVVGNKHTSKMRDTTPTGKSQ